MARARALRASPLLSPADTRRRSAGSCSHLSVKMVRSIRAEFAQRQSQAILARIRTELAQNERRGDGAVFDPRGKAQGFGELLLGKLEVQGRCADERLQHRPLAGFPWNVKALVGKISDPRCERESQEVAQRKDMIGETGGVGVVLFDPQIGLVIK
jgi:hypothetical protein